MRYLYCPCRCEFFPVTQQDICPVTQPDNRNSLVVHPDTQLSYRTPGCVTGVRLRNRTSCASVRNIYIFSARGPTLQKIECRYTVDYIPSPSTITRSNHSRKLMQLYARTKLIVIEILFYQGLSQTGYRRLR